MERKPLRTILFLLFFILILLLGAYFYINMRKDRIAGSNDAVMIQSPLPFRRAETQPQAPQTEEAEESPIVVTEALESPAAPAPEPIPQAPPLPERFVVDRHTVEEGESFSLITGYYWEDIFLWPDLYVRNEMRTDDPDLIYPQEIIDIYNRLGRGDSYTAVETEEILRSYLQVYRIYKALGPEKNNSVWSLLWCAAKYDHQFLDKYASLIDPEDLAMARKYIEEEGFLE